MKENDIGPIRLKPTPILKMLGVVVLVVLSIVAICANYRWLDSQIPGSLAHIPIRDSQTKPRIVQSYEISQISETLGASTIPI